MFLTLFLPRPEVVVPHSRYLLGGVKLPRPVKMIRHHLYSKQDFVGLDGKITRDVTNFKEKFTLTFEHIHRNVFDTIVGKIERDENYAFVVNDGNLQIASTDVWGYISSVAFEKGGLYLRKFELELTEVS